MIEIKNIAFVNSKYNTNCFVCFINHLLPLRLKFANESFIALKNNEILGVITLDKDSKSYTRFKITKLILEYDPIQTAFELVNYVITRYKALGAQSFYVVADEKREDLIEIFKNELNFRLCASEYLYKINSVASVDNMFLKPFKKENAKEVAAFYNENINSYNRFLFSREEYQFINGCDQYVFYSEDKDKILGYFEVATKNGIDYYINFTIDFGYNIYLTDAVKFIYSKIKQKNKKFNLYIKIKDYFMNSKELITILKENKAEFVSKSSILAKDYLREIKNPALFKNTRIIFNDPTMA